TGSPAVATTVLPEPNLPTPTPTPPEPDTVTVNTPSAGGWPGVPAARPGTHDKRIGPRPRASPPDGWGGGNHLPDAPGSNPDATLTLAEHYDGTRWTVTPTPNAGPNFATLFGVAARDGQAWAAGVRLDGHYRDRALIEHWDGGQWRIADNPQPGSDRNLFYAVSATSAQDVGGGGDRQGSHGGVHTLGGHWDGVAGTRRCLPAPRTHGA